jgi:cell division GTPase FtsZ
MKISLKYGFLGLGMGGTSIAHACASTKLSPKLNQRPYTAMLINSNEIDLRKLNDFPNIKKLALPGYEQGVGRDIQLGEQAFTKHKELILQEIKSFFNDRHFIFISCGLGGGTGTGAIIEAIRLLHANGFGNRFGLLLTLPRSNEGHKVLNNALQRLQVIKRAMQGLGSIIIVDNEKLFQRALQDNPNQSLEEFMKYSNRHVAQLLHEMNMVTASYNPYGSYHFDASEWLNMLRTSGCLYIGKCVLPHHQIAPDNPITYLNAIKNSVIEGELSDGYDLKEATSNAVSVVTSTQAGKKLFTPVFIDNIHKFVQEQVDPHLLDESPVATYVTDQTNHLKVYTVFAGLNFPNRVSELVKDLNEMTQKRQERVQEKEDKIADALASVQPTEKKVTTDLESLLGEPKVIEVKKPENDPFSFLDDLK